jgi:hypothetical protein
VRLAILKLADNMAQSISNKMLVWFPPLNKTDESKRKEVGFWWEQKLQPDRPHPNKEVVLSKTNFIFFTPDKHITSYDWADKHKK